MKNISYSQYSQWATCPHRWKLLYIDDKREFAGNIHTLFGTAMHETLQEYTRISKKIDSPIRKSGSAALDLAFVAAGRCEVFWQRDINYWDMAAGIILVKESGGFITDLKGGNNYLNKKEILATNSNINSEFVDLIK